jgi:acetolactate synthase II small subunit
MKNTIQCEFDPQPGAIERILRVIRVRGFAVISMNAVTQHERMSLEMTVSGDRCYNNLCHQLEKLQEVQRVSAIANTLMPAVLKSA